MLAQEEYRRIVDYCKRKLDAGQWICARDSVELNIDNNTLVCIFSQYYVRWMKKMTPIMEQQIQSIAKRVQQGESLFSIASERSFSSYKLAKIYCKHILHFDLKLSKLQQDASLIPNATLRHDLLQCCTEDMHSRQTSELQRQASGVEFEQLLYSLLQRRNMCFETEDELRLQGKPKTPDVLFSIPMGLRLGSEWHVIHWIDSKAMFGDEDTFADHLPQLTGYMNRYGTGLVIYWHGCVEHLQQLSSDIAVTEQFPEEWIFPSGEAADGKVVSFDKTIDQTTNAMDESYLCNALFG